jgi:hypothetical protein
MYLTEAPGFFPAFFSYIFRISAKAFSRRVDGVAEGVVGVGEGVGEGAFVDVGSGLLLWDADGDGVTAGVDFVIDFIFTPLFQINFWPDLMQVNFRFAETLVAPTLEHLVPARVAP